MNRTIEEKLKLREVEDHSKYEPYDWDYAEYFTSLIPYYTKLLDEDFKTNKTHYALEVFALKQWGYKVFRNSQGQHKLQYADFAEV